MSPWIERNGRKIHVSAKKARRHKHKGSDTEGYRLNKFYEYRDIWGVRKRNREKTDEHITDGA